MTSTRRAFVIMPFGRKKLADGTEIDCDAIYTELLAPAIKAANLTPHRADADWRAGSIHADMFQDLLLAEFVVADLTMDNPNVWYEIGVRHALRSGGTVLTYAMRERLPFDLAGQRMHRYTLRDGRLDPDSVERERQGLTSAIEATLGAWRGRRASPVFQQLPSLQEPDWKTLKVGDTNELWEALEDWQNRIDVAHRKERPGDILVLAEETPNSVLELEALREAAKALLELRRPLYALAIAQRALAVDPDDLKARQLEGVALGRAGRHADARQALQRLSADHKDGETLSILARTLKDEWTEAWKAHPQRQADPGGAARDTAPSLQAAANAYLDAFRAEPANHYPGINALSLGKLWEHVTGRKSRMPLDQMAAGVSWCVAVEVEKAKNYWSLASRAELALVENRKDDAIDDYAEAAALAAAARDRFALDSMLQQLRILGTLGFRPEIVPEASRAIERADQQLDNLVGPRAASPSHVVLFSGHMIDDPAVRGPGKAKQARFPASKVAAAVAAIRARLDKLGAGKGDLGVCGGASGGDLLFAEACLERGMRLELRLARPEPQFLAESVTFADPDHRWEQGFLDAKAHANTTLLVMQDELGPGPKDVSVHDRCNRWMLYSALSQGLLKVSFVALWNGEKGDGPGGTQHMTNLVRTLTGRQPEIIDPGSL
ncbi:bacterial transcriptional activator domain-containing protein [Reyranella sp.]|uniref:bacterial transcriptional activator domain-containing protein n=1 Tax=Reyranella sp. TaxID=1929291 RepID=UPI0011FD89B4|nr:bacterial transcriptional activator domain-containing protein [Reyranella sp.]TAJ84765.1 MAG: tetratricopeptide repeat protein [Reyranella sp.]